MKGGSKRLCEICGVREAEFAVVQRIGGKSKRIWVCSKCALSVGVKEQLGDERPQVVVRQDLDYPCPVCGWTLKDLLDTSMLGCPHCYDAFAQEVKTIIEHIHRVRLWEDDESISLQRRLSVLEWQLKRAVEEERFEDAASLRDMIKKLRAQLKGGGDAGS